MAENSKKDELLVMRLIAEGENRVRELQGRLDWSKDRVEETVDELMEHEYVERVQESGDKALAITERGRNHLPQLVGEVMDETRQYLDSVSESFREHVDKVFPKVSIEVNIEEPGAEGSHECPECGKSFKSERGLNIHSGMAH